ncbi:MAG TPA: NAD-dependent succinate-semialdehyde dehydrogenase [Candidatus Competibacteraceae bacterium]|nr:NAD-dependent succinate-semialdehyde dehydrogenase [Candidatus Competibacteraceae bacterium]
MSALPRRQPSARCEALSRLRDPRLLREYAYVDGRWCAAADGRAIEVRDPASGECVGFVPALGRDQTRTAIEAAARVFPAWRALLPQQRAVRLRRWHELMLEHREDLALIMTLEQGKPLAEARGEIDYAASFVEWFAEEAKRLNGETLASHLPNRLMHVYREPVGVVAAVTPWNFPSAMITRKAAAALAAGCTMVVRPSEYTPFSALALAELAERAGIPAGVFSVVTGEAATVVGELCANPTVRAVSFTGSTEIGRKLLALGADTVKKMSMELGGHAPFLLFPDVDLDGAVRAALDAKFQTSGQDCLAANRIYVHESLYEAFLTRFAAATQALRVGPGLDEASQIGPLMHERAVAKCEEQVRDAVAKGARLLCGGRRHDRGPLFFQPTVLADVTADMLIAREETFAPVAAVMPFQDEAEVLALANATEYGLVAYVFSHDHDRIARLSRGLQYGMVAVNCVKITGHPIPFGGVKQSGLGREGGRHGIEEYTELKYVCSAYTPYSAA